MREKDTGEAGSKPAAGLKARSYADGARLLADARIKLQRLESLPDSARPLDADEAYRCQDLLVDRLLAHYGGEIIGYKIACTNKLAQDLLHVTGPFHGKMFSAHSTESPGRLRAADFFMRVMEAEFAFRMARDLPAEAGPFTREQVADAVEGVLPGLEVVDSRFNSWTTVGGDLLIADNACHGAWVKGALIADWRGFDLAAQSVELLVNGAVNQTGTGAAVLGHPLNALEWLANDLSARGTGLRAGQYITTGVTTGVYLAERGDRVEADFGHVGHVEMLWE
jgi:2-keto-4-pentenoate hydratase